MVNVTVIVWEAGTNTPDFSLEFELPEVPAIGSFISIRRIETKAPFGEDVIVRKVLWKLLHPETHGFPFGDPKIGSLEEIILECEPALSVHSSEHWRKRLESARQRGVKVEEFGIARRVW